MATSTVILVPGFWLGSWAWDEVAPTLRSQGVEVDALTLPGLDRGVAVGPVTIEAQIDAVVERVRAASSPVVLVGHSGAGAIITGAADAVPDRLSALVFVDSGPAADGAVASPELPPDSTDVPLPSWEELEAAGSSLVGLDAEMLARFRERAVPHPAGPAREPLVLRNEERHRIPVTLVCTSFPAAQVRAMADAGHPWFVELGRFDQVELVDLPTGHWPMWSRPEELATLLAGIVR